MAINARGDNQQGSKTTPDCVELVEYGVMQCHAMLCMHVVDSRRHTVHGEHENSGVESTDL